jgi:hypothetical protein
MDNHILGAFITTVVGLTVLALLLAGLILAPWLLLAVLLMLLSVLYRFDTLSQESLMTETPLDEVRSASATTVSDPENAQTHAHLLSYRGAKYSPSSVRNIDSTPDRIVMRVGQYRGAAWTIHTQPFQDINADS